MNTRVRRQPLGAERSGAPHPNALSVIQHVQQYLAGCQNEEALEAWILAVGTGLQQGLALDGLLKAMCERWNAAALTVPPVGRAEAGAANDRRREA